MQILQVLVTVAVPKQRQKPVGEPTGHEAAKSRDAEPNPQVETHVGRQEPATGVVNPQQKRAPGLKQGKAGYNGQWLAQLHGVVQFVGRPLGGAPQSEDHHQESTQDGGDIPTALPARPPWQDIAWGSCSFLSHRFVFYSFFCNISFNICRKTPTTPSLCPGS